MEPIERHVRAVPFVLRRVEGAQLYVEGVAYPSLALPADGAPLARAEAALRIDSYGTFMAPDTLAALAHRFLEYGRKADAHHDHGVCGDIVESYITRDGDPAYPPGCWVAKVKVHDAAVRHEVDTGVLTGFSIEILAAVAPRTVAIEGAGKVPLGELLDPLPLFLSLVDRPAIGQPFASIETRATAGHPYRTPPHVRHVVRCAAPDDPARPEETMEDTAIAPSPRAPEPPAAAPTAAPPAPPAAPPTAAAPDAPAPAAARAAAAAPADAPAVPTAQVARAVTAIGVARAAELRQRAGDGTDFAALWADCAVRLRTWNAIWDATYLLDSVYWNIRYTQADDTERYALAAQAARDYAGVVATIVAEATAAEDAAPAARAAAPGHVRAGKKISAARMDKIKAARTAAAGSVTHLDELVAEVEGAEDEDEDAASATRAAAPAAPDAAALLRAAEDRLAEAQRAAATHQAAAQTATDERDAARAKLTAAEQRVADLEARRPPSMGRDPETSDGAVDAAPQKRSVFTGTLFRND